MNKIKNILFVAALVCLGLSVNSKAEKRGWVTFTSTGVCLATGTNLEVYSVEWSSGGSTGSYGSSWLVGIASNAIRASASTLGSTLQPGLTLADFQTPNQFAISPIVLNTTNTINALMPNNGGYRIDYKDRDGNGRSFPDGIVFIKGGTDSGNYVTVEYGTKR